LANPLDRKADVRLRMGLGCSLYMRDPQCPRTRLALARCADHYLDLVGRRIASGMDSVRNASLGDYRPGDVRLAEAIAAGDDVDNHSFGGVFYGEREPRIASHFGLEFGAASSQAAPCTRVRPSSALRSRWAGGASAADWRRSPGWSTTGAPCSVRSMATPATRPCPAWI